MPSLLSQIQQRINVNPNRIQNLVSSSNEEETQLKSPKEIENLRRREESEYRRMMLEVKEK